MRFEILPNIILLGNNTCAHEVQSLLDKYKQCNAAAAQSRGCVEQTAVIVQELVPHRLLSSGGFLPKHSHLQVKKFALTLTNMCSTYSH